MQNNLHLEILTEECKKQFKKLSNFKEDFYLAGGTAMALQMGHRISVDLDFFCENKIKKTLLGKVEKIFSDKKIIPIVNSVDELTISIEEVKYTFLFYPFPIILDLVNTDNLKLLSVKEILATKAYSIGRRGTMKDYVDLYFGILENMSTLPEIVELANKKYGEVFNSRLFLEQLVYMDDIGKTDVFLIKRDTPSKEQIINFFEEKIKELGKNI